MKKLYWMILSIIIIAGITVGMMFFFGQDDHTAYINRALAAKMVVAAQKGEETWNNDKHGENGEPWYKYYIDEAAAQCGMYGEDRAVGAMDLVTYGEAKQIAETFGADTSGLSFDFQEVPEDQEMPSSQWYELYDIIIKITGNIQCAEILILATPSNNSNLLEWQCLTDQGVFSAEGISIDPYINSNITVYVCGNEIVSLRDPIDGEKTLYNVWVVSGQEKSLSLDIGGYTLNFSLSAPLAADIENVVADVTFDKRNITLVTLKSSVIKGEILEIGEDYVDIKNYGKVYTTERFRVYSLIDGIREQSWSDLEEGNQYTEFVIEGDRICAAVIRAGVQAKTIRVLLSCDGYSGYAHTGVSLTSSVSFWTVCGDTRNDYDAGTVINIDSKSVPSGQTMYVQTSATAGTVELLSLNRNGVHPEYRGNIEITNTGDGYVIVNELLLEDYLYGVVPSEMPPSYELEALKVQAICARSFAADAIENPRFPEWNAHVDDSTSTQVYNNTSEHQRSNKAVDDTVGQVLQWQDDFVQAYFYSTSCGSSSSPGEVWLSGESPEYMQGRLQILGESDRDLSGEDAFRSFIDDYESKDYFEKDISWFRWKTVLSLSDIKVSVDKNLLTRIRTVPSLITVMDENGNFIEKEISTVGDICNVYVDERSKSGILKSVVVEGTEQTIRISGEYNIRLLLAPLNSDVICDDGTNAGTMTLLPSGYFYIDDLQDGTLMFRGGGYGHGVGMSQNGVQKLAQQGLSCEEILNHYFQGTTIAALQ